MREDLILRLEAVYEETRRRNEREEQRRREEIRGKYPELALLMDQRQQLIYGTLRDALRGKKDTDQLPERMEAISAEIRRQLLARGYREDYLSPVYTCAVCRDTGYTGEPVRKMCDCMRKAYQELLREESGLSEGGAETFEKFDLSLFPDTPLAGSTLSQRALMSRVRDLCEHWADTYPDSQYRDLVLTGASGLGKTFLLKAMAERLTRRGIPVLLISAFQFLQTARKSYFENSDGLQELLETDVLMLDDLGSEPLMQNITVEQLFYLINERQGRNLATVISTNLDLKTLQARYTERITSRLMDRRVCAMVPLQGEDIRPRRGNRQ